MSGNATLTTARSNMTTAKEIAQTAKTGHGNPVSRAICSYLTQRGDHSPSLRFQAVMQRSAEQC